MNTMKPNKKILFISNSLFYLSNFRSELIETFAHDKYEVFLCVPRLKENEIPISNRFRNLSNVNVLEIDMDRSSTNILSNLISLYQIFITFIKIKPDIILLFTIKPVIFGSLCSMILGVKNCYSFVTGLGHVFIDEKKPILKLTVKAFYKLALNANKKIFFQNTDDINTFKKASIMRDDKIVLVKGSGVNLEKFKYSQKETQDTIHFLFIGRLVKEKGIVEYLKAATKIKRKYKGMVEFHVVGDFDDNPSAISESDLIEYVKLNSIIYHGFISNMPELLKKCDVFVLPSYREGTPKSGLEAMASSKPLLLSDVPGCTNLINGNKNGYLFKPRSWESLSSSIEKIIKDKKCINVMGKESFEYVQDNFCVFKINSQILKHIK